MTRIRPGRRAILIYATVFLVLAAVCAVIAAALWDVLGWAVVPLAYAAVSFVAMAAAYLGAGPSLLMKRATGRHSVGAWLVFGPYFLLNAVAFRLYRLLSREPAYAQVAPNLYCGRRLLGRDVRNGGWVSVLDLAAEFAEIFGACPVTRLPVIPVLDATAPAEEQLRSAVAWLAEALLKGPVYVHCVLGHGRTATVVIAYLLSVGSVRTVADGLELLRASRPGTEVSAEQRRRLWVFERPNPTT